MIFACDSQGKVDQLILPIAQASRSCYILYRLDEKLGDSYLWIFIYYIPDTAPVRDKMLYASTKSTMKQEFGGGLIKEEMFGNVPDDISLHGYKKHLAVKAAPGPLSALEEDIKYVNELEGGRAHISVDSKHETMKSVGFPVVREALEALRDFKNKKVNYVQLLLDITAEEVHLALSESTTVTELPSRIPTDTARYHLFRFDHTYEGDRFDSAIFIYSMPGYKCPIKERMLYSSCKSTLLDVIENEDQGGIEITRKLELDSGEELSEDYLLEEIHPKKNLHRPAFAKPKGPVGKRGPKRMIKKQEGEQ
ncbi:Twinfilin-1 [Apostichopus japonicus]|uniref:Twinfilin-1 n=1 Tax=Stichopus japonicus TaxID=307972 RepID=A0A2G8L1Q2_STIJA|nr:Twinfilin-1 [Apostichopus japonicus]